MNTRFRFSMIAETLLGATIVALLAAGCGSKASSGPGGMAPPAPGGGTSGPSPLSMTVDGQPWSADQMAPTLRSIPRLDWSDGRVLISSGSARYRSFTRAGRRPKLRSHSIE